MLQDVVPPQVLQAKCGGVRLCRCRDGEVEKELRE